MSMGFAFEHSRSGTPVPPPSDPISQPVPPPEPLEVTVPGGDPHAPQLATMDASGVLTPMDGTSQRNSPSPGLPNLSRNNSRTRNTSRDRIADLSAADSLASRLDWAAASIRFRTHANNNNTPSDNLARNINPSATTSNMQADSDLDLMSDDAYGSSDENQTEFDRVGRASERARSRSRGSRPARSHIPVYSHQALHTPDFVSTLPSIPSYLTATAYGERYARALSRLKASRHAHGTGSLDAGRDLHFEGGLQHNTAEDDSVANGQSKGERLNKSDPRPSSEITNSLRRQDRATTSLFQRIAEQTRAPVLPQIFTSRSAIGLDDHGAWIGEEASIERAAAIASTAADMSSSAQSTLFLSDSAIPLPQVTSSFNQSTNSIGSSGDQPEPQLGTEAGSASLVNNHAANSLFDSLPPVLPCKWDDRGHSSVTITDRGSRIEFPLGKSTGSSSSSSHSSATLRADQPIPSLCGVYYYEVMIEAHGADQVVSVGICKDSAPLQKIPGQDSDTWGYHSDDGRICVRGEATRAFGPRIQAGDVLGCGLNFNSGTIFYTKNGLPLGTAFSSVPVSKCDMYPCIGFKAGSVLNTNFGSNNQRFLFDIDKYVADEKKKVLDQIFGCTDTLEGVQDEAEFIKDLVSNYFAHVGYIESSRAFEEDRKRESDTTMEQDPSPTDEMSPTLVDIVNRRRVYTCVVDGDIDGAFKLLNTFYPSVLADNSMIKFKLQCRKFLEMVRDPTKNADAIAYGRELHSQYRQNKQPQIQTTLKTIFSVLAYPDPSYAPEVAHLVNKDQLVNLAEELNSSVLISQGKPGDPSIKRLVREAASLTWYLAEEGDTKAALINVQDDFFH